MDEQTEILLSKGKRKLSSDPVGLDKAIPKAAYLRSATFLPRSVSQCALRMLCTGVHMCNSSFVILSSVNLLCVCVLMYMWALIIVILVKHCQHSEEGYVYVCTIGLCTRSYVHNVYLCTIGFVHRAELNRPLNKDH